MRSAYIFFFFNDTATTEIYTLSLHDALPIYPNIRSLDERDVAAAGRADGRFKVDGSDWDWFEHVFFHEVGHKDRKSTRLNSSHANISYAVFCLKKKKSTIPLLYTILHVDARS